MKSAIRTIVPAVITTVALVSVSVPVQAVGVHVAVVWSGPELENWFWNGSGFVARACDSKAL